MPARITVLYPSATDASFNMDYYMKTHMPLVMDSWGSYGLKSWEVSKIVGTATGEDAPYTVQALLHFESLEKFQEAASGPKAPIVLGDIPNFSNKEPVILIGDVVGTEAGNT